MKQIKISNSDREKLKMLELDILVEIDRICKLYNITYTLAYGTLIGAIRHKGFIPWDDDVDICMLRSDYRKFEEVCKKELNAQFFYQSHETDSEYFYLFNKIRMNNTVFKETVISSYNINHGVYIDIFPVDYLPEGKIAKEIQFLKFHFFRTGLQSKYLIVKGRSGWKKYAAYIMRILYAPWKLEKLYYSACNVAQKYDNKQTKEVASFCSPYKKKDIFPVSYFKNVKECDFENYKFFISKNYDEMLRTLYGDYMQLPPVESRLSRHNLDEFKI